MARHHSEEMIELLAAHATTLGDAPMEDVIRGYVRAMLAAHAHNPALHRALVHQAMHIGVDQLLDMQTRGVELVEGWLSTRRAQIAPTNLRLAAYIMVTTVEGITHSVALEHPELLADPSLLDEVVALLVRYLQA